MNKEVKEMLSIAPRVLFFLLTILATAFVVKKCNPESKNQPIDSKIQQIETCLQPIILRAEIHETKATDGKFILNGLSQRFDILSRLINQSHDTVYILAMCDSVRQDYANYQLNATNVIAHLDSAIVDYKLVIQSKDTIIEMQRFSLENYAKATKKLKRQRNMSLIANAVLAGLVIIK